MGQRAHACGWPWLGSVLACAIACGGGDERDPTASADGMTGIGSLSADDSGSADDSDPTLGKLDVMGGDGGGSGPIDTSSDSGCKKVDLLFVIDDSGSMADEQINLVAAFPEFIDGMRTRLADADGYNVGVISSDVYTGDFTCMPLVEGALITRTAGASSSNAVCDPFTSGLRFMTEADDLETKFACTAQIGTGGDGNERPAQALAAALSPALGAAGACNEGFLREDALLVVVLITDEEDDHETMAQSCMMAPQLGSAGEPADWFAAVTAAKGGDEAAIVVLSLVGPSGADACPALDKCNGGIVGAEPAPRILEFTDMFTYGFVGPVCQPYGPFFLEAIDVIESACDDFEPPG
ncbi:MAG TPA: hypothetical protein VFG69_19100 [Nannocystaceae bacterium]|nr:hypothetical protein [Nannocystaceae bacterium]